MNRVEENEELLKTIKETYTQNQDISHKEANTIHLAVIVGVLSDISKSLSVIADTMEERNENHE